MGDPQQPEKAPSPQRTMSPGERVLSAFSPHEALAHLASSERILFIGVRHHSPACSAAVPILLQQFAPTQILVELPSDHASWLDWLGHPDTQAPVALVSAEQSGRTQSFYPFADFSPELAAIRYANQNKIPVTAFDAPVGNYPKRVSAQWQEQSLESSEPKEESHPHHILELLTQRAGVQDSSELWELMVEAPAPGQSAEAIRRAGLLYGYMARLQAESQNTVEESDRAREAWMQSQLGLVLLQSIDSQARVAVIAGAFHIPALCWALEPHSQWALPSTRQSTMTSALIPYSFDLLDSRSGYPAGIEDPLWRQRIWAILSETLSAMASAEARGETHPFSEQVEPFSHLAVELTVQVCRQFHQAGFAAGTADAMACVQLAQGLSALRGLPAPSRREVLESLTSILTEGALLGRGRALSKVLEPLMVGKKRGSLPEQAPRSGLIDHVIAQLKSVRLPCPTAASSPPTRIRLDPLRSRLDRTRSVLLHRLVACHVSYAERLESTATGGLETLTQNWALQWTPATDASLTVASLWGISLEQAAEGALRARQKLRLSQKTDTIDDKVALIELGGEAGLSTWVRQELVALSEQATLTADLPGLIKFQQLLLKLEQNHITGLVHWQEAAASGICSGSEDSTADTQSNSARQPGSDSSLKWQLPEQIDRAFLLTCSVRLYEGLGGSKRIEDVQALLELVRLIQSTARSDSTEESSRLVQALLEHAALGSALMQGASLAALALLGTVSSSALGERIASWIDQGANPEGRRALSERLTGCLKLSSAVLEVDPLVRQRLMQRIETLDDNAFLQRLPALRHGFSALDPVGREALLQTLAEQCETRVSALQMRFQLTETPERLAQLAQADRAGRTASGLLSGQGASNGQHSQQNSGLNAPGSTALGLVPPQNTDDTPPRVRDSLLGPLDRWRLILGKQREHLSPAGGRVARCLDELYGYGGGDSGSAATQDSPYPSVRTWSEDLELIFGPAVREEVLARAAEGGRLPALLVMDPEQVTPSFELLQTALSLSGALPEAKLGPLRMLIAKIVEQLAQTLAERVRPALGGLTVPRPARRHGGRADLQKTIARNLKTVHQDGAGVLKLAPEVIWFKTRVRKHMDWHLLLLVDVSGSMEESTIFAAMMASIFSALPAITVSFLTFSTEVIDLSERVTDPLSLLLEISIGGGTRIGKALSIARAQVKVPTKTLMVLITDFEESDDSTYMVEEAYKLTQQGVRTLGLAALSDKGVPRYNRALAERMVGAGMRVAALTPLELAQWVGEQMR